MKRFLCKHLPHPCSGARSAGGADLYKNVEYKWIFHHQPELIVSKRGRHVTTVQLAPLDEEGLHKLWSTYFPHHVPREKRRLSNSTQKVRKQFRRFNSTWFNHRHPANDATARTVGNDRALVEPREGSAEPFMANASAVLEKSPITLIIAATIVLVCLFRCRAPK